MQRHIMPFRIALIALALVAGSVFMHPHRAAAAPVFSLSGGLTFIATQNSGIDPVAQTVTIANSGNGTLNWQASTAVNWLTLSASSGTAPSTLSVQARNTLAVGTYTTTIDFVSADDPNIKGSVPVSFTVNATNVLSVSKTSFTFKVVQGKQATQYLVVQSGAPAGWTGTVTSTPSWLSITPTTDTVYNDPQNHTVSVRVDANNLLIQSYTGSITISSAGATPSSITIPVTLRVTPPPVLDAAPRPLTVSVDQGNTASPSFTVNNNGASETDLTWSIAQPRDASNTLLPWLALSLTGSCNGPFPDLNGTTSGGRTSTVTVCVDTTPAAPAPKLTPGTYSATVTVSAPDANPTSVTVPITVTVNVDTTPPKVVPGSVFFGHYDLSTTPVSQITVAPSATCGNTPSYNVEISWTSTEFGDTRFKWGEQLDASGVPLYERGTILKTEGLDTINNVGGTLYHQVVLTNMNYIFPGHTYYFALASEDRYGNPTNWSAPGIWADHDQNNTSLYSSFSISHSCDIAAPTNVTLQLPGAPGTLFGTITVIMSAQDESLIKTFTLNVTNNATTTTAATYDVAPGSCTSNGDSYSCSVTATLNTHNVPDGSDTFVLQATDPMNQTSSSQPVTVMISNAVPSVTNIVAAPTQVSGDWQTVITWTTDTMSDSQVQYGMEEDDGTFKGYTSVKSGDDSGSTYTLNHSITLLGLLPGRVYHYMITSCPQGISDADRCGH